MNNSRIALLKQYLEEEPEEPFNLYALAMEYLGEHPSMALSYFETLLAKHPDYLGTYYHAGKLYQAFQKEQVAKEIFEKGIALAIRLKETKALAELRNAWNELLDEEL